MDNPIIFERKNVKDIYNLISNEFSSKRFSKWSWIELFLDDLDTGLILDIGCGNGRNMTHTKHQFVGIDNCENFIKICLNKGLNVINCDMTKIPLKENYFDCILSIASFHHLSCPNRRHECLKEMSRMLKPNGSILLSVWSYDQTHNYKLKFEYGNNYVPWKNKDGAVKGQRYYYIFKPKELRELLEIYFKIELWDWNYGNEIIILKQK